jgi:NADPH:quinone reductase-like Zn-dependent oxidoreductase
MSWPEAAAVPEAFLTAFDSLFARGGLTSGECCLIQAAASGVGIAALQLAREAGARTVGLCRTEEKRRRLDDAGYGGILDPAIRDISDAIVRSAGRDEIDLVLDMVGPSAWPLYERVLRARGRIVLLGFLGGARADLDLGFVLRKRITVTGTALRSRPLEEKIALTRRFARRVLPQFVSGRLTAWVDRTYDASHVSEAHEAMERNENLGKIVLTFDAD